MKRHLLFVPVILLLAASCNSNVDNKTRFGTEADCEIKTGMFCVKVLCDYVPPGKTYKDVCPYGQGYYESSGTTLEDHKKQQDKQYNQNIQNSSSTQPAAQIPSWKNMVYDQFKNLTDWQIQENATDWNALTLDPKALSKFGTEKIFVMSKTFNGQGFSGPDVNQQLNAAGEAQKALEGAITKILSNSGWTLTAEPTEAGFYQDYLYVKDGHPLVLQTGTRDAVTGGMYIRIEFQY